MGMKRKKKKREKRKRDKVLLNVSPGGGESEVNLGASLPNLAGP
jgi:hypothetical protein